MTIAIINETSAADRNPDIVGALQGGGHNLINCGMKKSGEDPQLAYIQTGFLGGLLLNLQRVDFVVGGCGTGQGFLNAVVQYPNVVCGHILTPLDAWLFTRINGGNCVSLMLNQGYGWGSEINLRLIFDHLFSSARGEGFPESRKASQRRSASLLARTSEAAHRRMSEIVRSLPDEVVVPALGFPGIRELVFGGPIDDGDLREAIELRSSGQPSAVNASLNETRS